METFEIESNNIIIANFMGLDLFDSNKISLEESLNTMYNYAVKYQADFNDEYFEGELIFHRSWDWLMPVIEKIMGIDETKTDYGISFVINCHGVSMNYKGWSISASLPEARKSTKHFDTRFECLYFVCVEFIKYYNSIQNS